MGDKSFVDKTKLKQLWLDIDMPIMGICIKLDNNQQEEQSKRLQNLWRKLRGLVHKLKKKIFEKKLLFLKIL